MEVHDVMTRPVPRDRVVMAVDMREAEPCWEFVLWGEDGDLSGWWVGDQFGLKAADELGLAIYEAYPLVMAQPTHWAEVPVLPVHAASEVGDSIDEAGAKVA